MGTKIFSGVRLSKLLGFVLIFLAFNLNAQTTKTVGSGGNYTTLKLAFDAINAGSISGAITLQIIGSTTETTAAILYASGTGSSSYSSVNIYPTTSGLSISGNYNSHMIDLSGADNVTFDGRVNATGSTKDLTITNTSTGTSATTIRFINSAENNTVKYCNVTGSEVNQTRGIIFFSTSSSGNGNDNNLIDNNNITSNAGNRVLNAIYALGTTGRDNTGNTISNNNIYDVWRTSASSFAIQVSSYNSNWTITGNSIYETSTFVPTGAYTYGAIKLNYASGVGFEVTDNYIGGQSPQCGGSALTVNAATAHLFQAIMLYAGTSTASSVQNNTIKNFDYTGSSTSLWQGIYIAAGAVNVGTVTGNKIGASTGTGSIVVTGNVNSTVVQGINFAGNGAVNIQNNTIGSFTINNSNSTYSNNFYAINRTNTGTSIIANNLIGSTETSNSIQVTSASTASDQSVFGIRNTTGGGCTYNNNTIANMSNATTNITSGTLGQVSGILSNYGITTITNNNIYNLTIANNNTASSSAASVTGIAVASTNALNTIAGNKIFNLSNTYASFTGTVIGIYFGSTGMYTTISHTVTGNFIHDLSITGASASGASIYGIKINTGQTTYANNIISLGGNTANTIYGIYEYGTSANNNSLYFNTVYIGGSLNAGVTNKSYALYSAVSSNVRNFRNNIFANARSTASGSNLHYAAYLNYSSTSSISLNYNDYYVSGTGGVLGYHNSTNKTALPIITGKDTNSTIVNPAFTNAGGTSASDYYSTVSLSGASGTNILSDYYGITRSATPKIGALEGNTHTYTWQGGTSTDFGTASNWVGGVVPPDGSDILFASNPDRNCVLDQNRNLGIVTNAQGTDLLIVNGKQLTLTETINFSNGAQIDATTASSVIVFESSTAQSIPAGAFVSNTVDGLTLNNSNGLTLNSDLTVTQTLTLTSGDLNIGANTLTLNGAISTASGMLNGGSTSNMVIGGSGSSTTLPNVLLNNFTLNRANGITLSGDLNISGTLALTNGSLSVSANTLAIFGNSITRTSGNINASNSSATLEFANSSSITLPASLFSGAINNLTISGTGGVTAGSDITVNGVLNLNAVNPSATRGLLEMTIDYTGYPGTTNNAYLNSHILYMGSTATTTGTGDVTGTIRRNTIIENTPYTFGHRYTTILLTTGIMPTALSVSVTIGNTPPGDGPDDIYIRDAYKRTYEIVPTVPEGYTSTSQVTANFHYLDNEMTSSLDPYHVNTEENTVTWDYDIGGGIPADEHGRADYDFTNKFIGLANVPIDYFINIPAHQWRTIFTLRDYRENHYTWNGSRNTSWDEPTNWTISTGGAGVPSSASHVVIPNVSLTNNLSPVLPTAVTTINSLTIQNGGILTMGSNTLTIQNSFSGGWEDQNPNGNDPGTSTVIFSMHGTTISGNARFYNAQISDGADISNKSGSKMYIQNTITKTGTGKWYADLYDATVEYCGGSQTVLLTDGIPHYHNLILSGSGTKTFPSALTLHGNLTLSGTAAATAAGSMTISGNLLIETDATFNTGAYDHTISGNFDNSGTFVANSLKTITLNGTTAQSVYGSSASTFENLIINNTNGVNTYANINVNGALTLSNGNLNVGPILFRPNGLSNKSTEINKTMEVSNRPTIGKSSYQNRILSGGDITLTLNGTITTGSGTLTGGDSSVINIAGNGATATLPPGTFNNMTVNRPNGVNLSGDATINGSLNLSNGLLNTNGHILTFGTTASDPIESSVSRIVGTSRILNIPVGTGAFSFLSCSIAGGSDDLGNVSIIRKTGDIGIVNVNGNTSIKCIWDITSDSPPVSGRSLEYKWLSDLDNGKTFSAINLAVNYFSSDNGVSWNVHGSPVDVSASNPRVLSYSTTHFSYWVASDLDSPLPVTLSSLNSTVHGRNVKLSWITASEINNKGFEVERKTISGSWSKVGFINGKGTVNTTSNYSFEDRFLTTGKYSYRLKQIDYNGNFEYHNMNGVVEIGVPTKYDLSQNYPNPFNPVTKINYELPFDSKVSLVIYDMTGREIKTLVNEIRTAGYYTLVFDASNISSGTYFFRIIANANGKDYIATKKMVLVK